MKYIGARQLLQDSGTLGVEKAVKTHREIGQPISPPPLHIVIGKFIHAPNWDITRNVVNEHPSSCWMK